MITYMDLGVCGGEFHVILHLITGKEVALVFGRGSVPHNTHTLTHTRARVHTLSLTRVLDVVDVASMWALAIDSMLCNNYVRRVIPLETKVAIALFPQKIFLSFFSLPYSSSCISETYLLILSFSLS